MGREKDLLALIMRCTTDPCGMKCSRPPSPQIVVSLIQRLTTNGTTLPEHRTVKQCLEDQLHVSSALRASASHPRANEGG